jgi:putative NADH-flavin reductase
MKLLVLGAGGKTGSAVVQQAVAAGHQVTAFVHHADDYHGPAGVTIKEGDATDADAVAAAVAGQDAVIDTIGGKTPYKSNITLEDEVAKAVVAAMQRHAVRRLLVTSMVGEGDSVANASVFLRILLKTFLRGATADKAAMERDVEASGLDWTIARPAVLNDDPATGDVRVFDPATGIKAHKIARADLAAWLVAQLSNTEFVHRAITVATS